MEQPSPRDTLRTSKRYMIDPKQLLEKVELVKTLDDSNELVLNLFHFFEAYSKETELLKWAIEKEVQETQHPSSLCRSDTFLSKLFYLLLFGDLGKKYLSATIVPLVKKIITTKSLQEESISTVETMVSSEQEVRILLCLVDEFLQALKDSVSLCPISLREGFLTLYQIALSKFENDMNMQTMGSVIFLRFYCPTVIFPAKYGLINEDEIPKAPKVSKALVVVSKILQCIANGSEFEPTKTHSSLIDKFILSKTAELLEFTSALLNEAEIKKYRAIVNASVSITVSDANKNLAEENLKNFLNASVQKETGAFNSDQLLADIKAAYLDEGWKLVSTKKNMKLFQKKEGSGVQMNKVIITIPANIQTVAKSLRNFEFDKCYVNSVELIEKTDENQMDIYMVINYPFPMSTRDFVCTRCFFPGDQQFIMAATSISRIDKPSVKGYIRGHVSVCGVVLDPVGDHSTLMTYISHFEMKGTFPSLTISASDSFKLLSRYFKTFKKGPRRVSASEIPTETN